jgi:hypothetical protein
LRHDIEWLAAKEWRSRKTPGIALRPFLNGQIDLACHPEYPKTVSIFGVEGFFKQTGQNNSRCRRFPWNRTWAGVLALRISSIVLKGASGTHVHEHRRSSPASRSTGV